MSKLRTDDPMHPEGLPFMIWETQRPSGPDDVPAPIAILGCALNVHAAWAIYDTMRERTPGRYIRLCDCGRIIAESWKPRVPPPAP